MKELEYKSTEILAEEALALPEREALGVAEHRQRHGGQPRPGDQRRLVRFDGASRRRAVHRRRSELMPPRPR